MIRKPLSKEDIALLKQAAAALPIFPVCDVQGNVIAHIKNGNKLIELQKPFRRLKKAFFKGKLMEEIKLYDLEYKTWVKKSAEKLAEHLKKETGKN